MMCHGILVFCVFFSLTWDPVLLKLMDRRKRLLYGIPMEDRDSPYDSVRYYVWLGNGHNCDIRLPKYIRDLISDPVGLVEMPQGIVECDPSPHNLLCGGSLLTEKIVQTACHCVAKFDGKFTTTLRIQGRQDNVWEGLLQIYPGQNSLALMKTAIYADRYIIHQRCARIYDDYFWAGMITHDFAVIRMKSYVSIYPNLEISYAPAYRKEELSKIWYDTLDKEYMCLFLGTGRYRKEGKKVDWMLSDVLRYGWRVILNYLTCRDFTYEAYYFPVTGLNYTQEASWLCSQAPTGRDDQFDLLPGDSGSPVTCKNRYLALNTMRSEEFLIGWTSATAFAIYENSYEYRPMLIDYFESLDIGIVGIKFQPTNSMHGFAVRAKKSQALKTEYSSYHLVLLSLILLFQNT